MMNVLMILASAALPFAADVWFAADFDRPAVMGGEMLEHEVPDDALVEGRYGKACFFRRGAKNVLLPTADFLAATNSFEGIGGVKPVADAKSGTLAFVGGEMRFLPQSSGQPNSWSTKVVSTTFAMEVKGEAGGELVLTPEITELTEQQVKALQKSDRGFSPANCLPNVAEPRSFRLTGDWQRVWGVATYDIRTRRARRIGWKVKAGGPVTMRRFLQQPTDYSHYRGVKEPTEWVEGGSSRGECHVTITDPDLLADFPCSNGTFSCWLKTPPGWVPADRVVNAFLYQPGWESEWGFRGDSFTTDHRFGIGFGRLVGRTDDWTHVAVTWNAEELVAYVNGERVQRREKPKLKSLGGKGSFTIGGNGMSGSADVMMDDIFLFRRALTADEVKAVATSPTSVLSGEGAYLASPPVFTAFPRNHAAALKFPVDAPRDGTLTVEAEIGGRALPTGQVTLKKGANTVACPFRAADFRPGKYPWKLRLLRGGTAAVRQEGTLTVLPAIARGAFRIMASGGTGEKELDLQEKLGFNSRCISNPEPKGVNRCEERGLRVDLRIENAGLWKSENFDFEKIRAKTVKKLKPFAGDPLWDSSLVNSEVYGTSQADEVAKFAVWRAIAKKELGHEPVVSFASAPPGVDWAKAGLKRPRGVLERSDVYDTFDWYMRRGMPQLMMTRLAADVVRELSPGATTWSEPSPSLESLEMSGDWIYSYDPWMCLGYLRLYEATPRGEGKRFMPFLSMGYWTPDFPEVSFWHPTQKDPKTGKNVQVWALQTCDELKIKSMACIAGSAADSISYFSPDWCWGQGCTNGALHEKGLPLVYCRGWERYCVGEKDAPERFGEFVRRDFLPSALLLRNVPNVRAPIALLLPREIDNSGEFWWPRVNYVRQLTKLLAKQAIPFDVLKDGEFNAATLSKYSYVFYPHLNCITPEHDRVIRSLPPTVKFLLDDNTCPGYPKLNYPNFERVQGLAQHFPAEARHLDQPMAEWIAPKVNALRAKLPAWSEEDGTNAWTFVKDCGGVRYVTVVNNARRAGGCPQAELFTNAWYRPMGSPQRIATRFAGLAKGAVVYEFNGAGKVSPRDGLLARDYAAAESRVFAVYPKALKAPELSLEGKPTRGGEAKLVVKIADADGRPAPGRTVVRLALADPEGRTADESGLHVVENGRAEITLRFAMDDAEGGLFSKWKAVVTDLTTGESGTVRFGMSMR